MYQKNNYSTTARVNNIMTKKLEDILNLPNVKEAFQKVDAKEAQRQDTNGKTIPKNVDPQTAKALEKTNQFDKIQKALIAVKGLNYD